MSHQPIADYGVIGDLHSVALVGRNGSIDFQCFPSFDSPTIFAALLDDARGGRFELRPLLDQARTKQIYLPDTAVLLTRTLSPDGVSEVSDFMPITAGAHQHDLVRRAKTIRGELRYRMCCAPRFDYARAGHEVIRKDHEVVFRPARPQPTLRLRSDVPLEVRDGDAVAEFTLRAGESAWFVLEEAREGEESASEAERYVQESFKETVNLWRRWVARSSYHGRWLETMRRSAVTLKLLTYRPGGSIVAAPTFGLPERIGGPRNWDYRFTWVRDASFTLYGLMRLGYVDEAAEFMGWIEARCRELGPEDTLQVMYGLDGRRDLTEHTLESLAGYRGSAPVRIGNAAHGQLQLDIYGALMDAVYLYDKYGAPVSYDLWTSLRRLLDWLGDHWERPDAGFWEVRGAPQEFLISRVMCWVAFDRGIRLALKRSLPAPIDRWRGLRDRLYAHVFEDLWDPRREAFVQHRGSKSLDASALLMPLMRFISATDPRWLSTLRAIEEDLVEDAHVYRYRVGEAADDGFEGAEGSFSMCSFWYAECVARSGDAQKARLIFEKMLGYANHLGLYAEELGPEGEHLGNFPQAFTHLALISAAFELDRALSAQGVEE